MLVHQELGGQVAGQHQGFEQYYDQEINKNIMLEHGQGLHGRAEVGQQDFKQHYAQKHY